MSYEKELAFAKELAREAGGIMRRYFQAEDIGTTSKEDRTPVTVADLKISDMVIAKVKEAFPEHGVLGEEESYEEHKEKLWVLDPIDGTMPFSIGIPVSAFCLAYVEDGIVKASVVHDPFQNRLYEAMLGGGAFLNGEALLVSDESNIADQYLALSLLQARQGLNVRIFNLYSYAYSAMLVASGNFVAAGMKYGSPWDAAAPSLIVEEAGGKVTDLNGKKRKYNEWGDGILMTNGKVHDELVELIDYENHRD